MVDYEKVVTELEKDKPLTLFVVVQMDELVDTWTVIFAADWVNDKNRKEIYKKISLLIDNNGKKGDIGKVSRIGIFDSSHYLVSGLLKYHGERDLKDIKINGNTIHNGIIFYPRKQNKENVKEKVSTSTK